MNLPRKSLMKAFTLLLCLSAFTLRGQVAAPPAPAPATPSPETVIAIVEGNKLTFGEIQSYLSALDPQRQKAALQNRTELVREYALMKHLATMADQAKLDQKSPYKEALASSRLQILTNAQINEQYLTTVVTAQDQQKFFEENKDRYSQVKLKVIYVSFVANPGAADLKSGKSRTEAEAKAKIEGLSKDLRAGADFSKMVKEYSEDEKSKAQNGDFGTLSRSDNLPEEIRSVVFKLKKGELSEPVRQRNGFYLFKAEDVSMRPYAEVKDDIYTELKNIRMREWFDKLSKSIPVKIEDQSFFSAVPAASNSAAPAPLAKPPSAPPLK